VAGTRQNGAAKVRDSRFEGEAACLSNSGRSRIRIVAEPGATTRRCAPVEGQYPGVLRALVHRRQKNLLAINLDSTPEGWRANSECDRGRLYHQRSRVITLMDCFSDFGGGSCRAARYCSSLCAASSRASAKTFSSCVVLLRKSFIGPAADEKQS
jgi:hypothetical protein